MATIKLKRGNNSAASGLVLNAGEPAFVLDTGKLYIGNGTTKVLINPDITNVATSDKLTTSRNIGLSGDVTGTVAFDGSGNVSMVTSYKNSGVTAGTYSKITVDVKGNVTTGTVLSATDIPNLDASKITSGKLGILNVPTGTTASTVSLGDHTHAVATASISGLMNNTDKTKLDGISTGANNYTHPVNHPASIVTQDANNRFTTDIEKAAWNAKSTLSLGVTSDTAYRGDYGSAAYTHSQSIHAPTTAQRNSDITKAEIEAKLIGDITSHTHAGGVDSTSLNTPNKIVQRDGSGNFSAGVVSTSSVSIGVNKVELSYNSSTKSLDFIFN